MRKITRMLLVLIAAVIAFSAMCIVSSAATYSWTGTWSTQWGDMTLTQNGSTVTGKYTHDDGTISGTVNGNVLTGTWKEPGQVGKIRFVMSSDGKTFSGGWGYNDEAPERSGWDGTRKTSVTYTDGGSNNSSKPSASLSGVSWNNSTQKLTFTISYSKVGSGAWVGIVPSGTKDDERSADAVDITYKYLSSLKSGSSASLAANLRSGTYELRVYATDDGGALLARARFTVSNSGGSTSSSGSIQYLTLTLEEGDSFKIGAVISGSGKITYSSSNTNVVSVKSNGKIKAKNAGTSYITVQCGSSSMKIKVTVTED